MEVSSQSGCYGGCLFRLEKDQVEVEVKLTSGIFGPTGKWDSVTFT
jgi:hypothetical protein